LPKTHRPSEEGALFHNASTLLKATPFAGRQEKEHQQATQKNYNDAQKQRMEQRQAPHQTALRALQCLLK